MGYIKNIPHESILRLAEQVSIQPVSYTHLVCWMV